MAETALPDPDPAPPVSAADFRGGLDPADFKGFQSAQPPTQQAQPSSDPEPPAPDRYELTLRLEKGDTIDKMLADIEVPETDRKAIVDALHAILKKRKIAVGEEIQLEIQTLPGQSDAPRVLSLSIRPQPEREYIVKRSDDGSYSGEEKTYRVSPRIVRVEGERHGSLESSGIAGGAPSQAMVEFIRALSYDVDFQRELKEGQKFTVLLEQLVTSDGKITHPGRLLAGELHLGKRSVTVIRFRPQNGAEQFYNPKGESVVRSFLRTPMDASKVTSRFGMRDHPILGYSAMHTGVDFGAPSGTPILAAGAGKVMMAGYNGGYGIFVKLEHTRDIGTGYGHMSRLGPGIKPGVAVRQGQVIGFVGSTGMSTGPHLHYEFYRGGRPVNPLAQKFAMQASVGGKDLARFKGLAGQYVAQLKNAPKVAKPDAFDDNHASKVDAGKRETAKEGRQPNVAARSRIVPKKHTDATIASGPVTSEKPAVKHRSKVTASHTRQLANGS
ncbi:MAG: peptidoglycan DD-metalloendopeptidase family protein [Reyranella sp.]|uniref:peptidoglycan DD-metalloendopeptidase family protein n=1 Tax=Reyranella sp. TaxID=1929291 RepID=UPI001AD09D76|nr:peptidoglycan DD-metalloendopeptidase family protein [Reyranella sp.]MBN9086235.1 peptidoglycan DD-metalloendopeptidase family protein [Reyranella sp.]